MLKRICNAMMMNINAFRYPYAYRSCSFDNLIVLALFVKELIKRCDPNKSVSQRQSALDGFRELILSSDAGKQLVLSSGYLMAVMTKSCSLLADAEMCVRRSVLRLCRLILSILELKEPIFLRTLCARLCCDLNHFSDSIRLDALKLFDMLLDKYPRFVTGKFCNLVPCAIEAALGPLSMECGGGRQANTLLFKPNSRTFCREWRIQMLSRLTAIVDVAIDLHFEEQNAEKFVEHQDWPYPYVSWKVRRHFSFAWQLDDTKGMYVVKKKSFAFGLSTVSIALHNVAPYHLYVADLLSHKVVGLPCFVPHHGHLVPHM